MSVATHGFGGCTIEMPLRFELLERLPVPLIGDHIGAIGHELLEAVELRPRRATRPARRHPDSPRLSTVDTGAIVLAFVSGGALGTVVTAAHDRAERFRERMIQAAERFLVADEEASRILHDNSQEVRRFQRDNQAWGAAQERLQRALDDQQGEEVPGFPPAIVAAVIGLAPLRKELIRMVRSGRFVDHSAEMMRVLEQMRLRAQEAEGARIQFPDVADAIGELYDFSMTVDVQMKKMVDLASQSRASVNAVAAVRPRIVALFGPPDAANAVAREAESVSIAIEGVIAALMVALDEDRDPSSDGDLASAWGDHDAAVTRFGRAVHARTQRWWF